MDIITHLNHKYDYSSVLHYSAYAFSKNGKKTIDPVELGAKIGQRRGFSQGDLLKLTRLYECPTDEEEEEG